MNTFKVGQLLYLIQPKKMAVVPVLVSEEIIKRTIDGEEIVYNVSTPGSNKFLELNKFDGEVFDDLRKVRYYLVNNAKKSIDQIIKQTEKIIVDYFDEAYQPSETVEGELLENNIPEIGERAGEVIEVDLGNGQVGKVKMPEESISEVVPLEKKSRRRGRPRKESTK